MSEIRIPTSVDELTPEVMAELSRRARAERAVCLREATQRAVARVKSWFGLARPRRTGPIGGANAQNA